MFTHNPFCTLQQVLKRKLQTVACSSRIRIFPFTISFRIASKHIEQAEAKLRETTDDNTNLHDRSILEKLLRLDKQTAHVMALEMLTSSIDTVREQARI